MRESLSELATVGVYAIHCFERTHARAKSVLELTTERAKLRYLLTIPMFLVSEPLANVCVLVRLNPHDSLATSKPMLELSDVAHSIKQIFQFSKPMHAAILKLTSVFAALLRGNTQVQ